MQAKFAQAIAANVYRSRRRKEEEDERAVAVAQVKNLAKLYAMIGRKKWQSSYFWFAIGI